MALRSILCQHRVRFDGFKFERFELDHVASDSYLSTQTGFTGHDYPDVDVTGSPKREELLEYAGVCLGFFVLSCYRVIVLSCIVFRVSCIVYRVIVYRVIVLSCYRFFGWSDRVTFSSGWPALSEK